MPGGNLFRGLCWSGWAGMMNKNGVRHVKHMYIFDLDGTILDSNGLWAEVDRQFLGSRGLASTREYESVVARSIFPVAAVYTKEYYRLPDSPEQIMAQWERLAASHYGERAELKPGAAELLHQSRDQGRPMTLFTACRPTLCRLALERFHLTELFDHVIYAEEIGLEKHDPRCFLRLSQLVDRMPEECTLFDDSPFNCATAAQSGMDTVGVYDCYYEDRQEELRQVCRRYVRSLEELLSVEK